MKSIEIVKEEIKKAFPTMSEAAVEAAIIVVCEKISPRLALEAEEAAVKVIATGLNMIYPTLKPAIFKATDFDDDGC